MRRIGIATSERVLPASDLLLRAALIELGFEATDVAWANGARDWSEFEAVIVRSCWDYHLHSENFLAWIAELERNGVVVVNSPELIRWNSDKKYLGELAAGGISIPETIYLESGEVIDLGGVCTARGWKESVIKPIVSASAHRTERRRSGIAAGPAMVQRFVSAIETEGEWSLIYIGGEYSHSVNKKPAARDFRVQEEHGGTVAAGAPPRGSIAFAERVLGLLPSPAAFARVDLVVDEMEIYLMELEVIEPELYLHLESGSAEKLAREIQRGLKARA